MQMCVCILHYNIDYLDNNSSPLDNAFLVFLICLYLQLSNVMVSLYVPCCLVSIINHELCVLFVNLILSCEIMMGSSLIP